MAVPRCCASSAGTVRPASKTKVKGAIKTPTLFKTGEEWGTQIAWKRRAKSKSKAQSKHPPFPEPGKSGAPKLHGSLKQKQKSKQNRKQTKTPTLPKTGEAWGTQIARKREAKPK